MSQFCVPETVMSLYHREKVNFCKKKQKNTQYIVTINAHSDSDSSCQRATEKGCAKMLSKILIFEIFVDFKLT